MKILSLLFIFVVAMCVCADDTDVAKIPTTEGHLCHLYIKSIKVADKKADGKAWDVAVGNNDPGYPDLKFFVYTRNSDPKSKEMWSSKPVFTSTTVSDVLSINTPIDTMLCWDKTKVYSDMELKVDVYDADTLSDDLIGSVIIKFNADCPEVNCVGKGQKEYCDVRHEQKDLDFNKRDQKELDLNKKELDLDLNKRDQKDLDLNKRDQKDLDLNKRDQKELDLNKRDQKELDLNKQGESFQSEINKSYDQKRFLQLQKDLGQIENFEYIVSARTLDECIKSPNLDKRMKDEFRKDEFKQQEEKK